MSFVKPKYDCLYPASKYTDSPLFRFVNCHKDMFYTFLNDVRTWRKIMKIWKSTTFLYNLLCYR